MATYTPRAAMSAEHRARERREAKRRRILTDRGTPSRTRNIADIQRHVRHLYYAGGMSSQAIAERSGVGRHTVMQLITGHRTVGGEITEVSCMLRSTIEKLWSVRLDPSPEPSGRGARIPPLGTRRRLQALNALGYDFVWMAERLGISPGNLHAMVTSSRSRSFVYASTARRVADLYAAYQHVDPALAGRSAWHVSTARTRARRAGYAPPCCWDDETIDLPTAQPEWTGACGTPRGYGIHLRERIPVCPRCRAARRQGPVSAAPADACSADGAVAWSGVRTLYPGGHESGRRTPRSAPHRPSLRREMARPLPPVGRSA
ncbi:hypothetical protein [Streptomyces sp. NPDC090021]|uniref:hypothetical protein n=1 Tax=Streptomyces sp. NPDC090021 TaxID=3365919 RepID=UPI00381A0A7D